MLSPLTGTATFKLPLRKLTGLSDVMWAPVKSAVLDLCRAWNVWNLSKLTTNVSPFLRVQYFSFIYVCIIWCARARARVCVCVCVCACVRARARARVRECHRLSVSRRTMR